MSPGFISPLMSAVLALFTAEVCGAHDSMAEALKAQGNAAFKEGRYDQAVGYFTSAIDLDGTNAVLFSNRSGAHASLGQFDKALSDADKAVPHLP